MTNDTKPPVSQESLDMIFEKNKKEILEKAKLVEHAFKKEHDRTVKNK
jgi:hypothetical protein